MKTCKYCGIPNEDSRNLCKSCGGLLPEEEKARKTKKSQKVKKSGTKGSATKGKIVAIILAAAVLTGIFGTILIAGIDDQIGYAWEQNLEMARKAVSTLPNLSAAGGNISDLYEDGKFNIKLEITSDILSAEGTMDYDRKEKQLAGTLAYANIEKEMNVEFDFASDDEEFLLSADRYTDDIYGFKLDKFAKFYSKTPVAMVFPLSKDEEDPYVDFFKKVDFPKGFEKKYGKAWENFRKSMDFKELNERDMEIGGKLVTVSTYEITWDSAAASKFISAALGRENGFSSMIELFKVMEPDCRVYVDENDRVAAVDFVAAGNKCVFKFDGIDNIWHRCTLTSVALAGGEGAIRGNLTIEGGCINADFLWDGKMSYELDYDDSTGDFSMKALTGDIPWYLDGTLTSYDGGSQLRVGGYLPTYGRVDISVQMEALIHVPEMMGDKYVDLMDMDVGNWQRLLIDINNVD